MIPLYMQRVEITIERGYPVSRIIATMKPGICSLCNSALRKKANQKGDVEYEYENCECEYTYDESVHDRVCVRKCCGNYQNTSFESGNSLCWQCLSLQCIWCSVLVNDRAQGAIVAVPHFKKGFYCSECSSEEIQRRMKQWINASRQITIYSTADEAEEITLKLRQSDANWLKQRLLSNKRKSAGSRSSNPVKKIIKNGKTREKVQVKLEAITPPGAQSQTVESKDSEIAVIKSIQSNLQTVNGEVFNHDVYKTEIRPSTYVTGEDGCFACVGIPAKQIITWYTGKVHLSVAELKKHQNNHPDERANLYALEVQKKMATKFKYIIDGFVPDPIFGGAERCLATYINHDRLTPNCEFEIVKLAGMTGVLSYRVAIRSLVAIAHDEELRVDYGDSYHSLLIKQGKLQLFQSTLPPLLEQSIEHCH